MKDTKKKRRWWPYILVGIVVLVVAARLMRSGDEEKKGMAVSVAKAEKRTIVETVKASGKIFPAVEVEITSNISGTIVELYVKEGQEVKEGQLLAKIDPEALMSVVERVEAATSSAKAQLESTRAQKLQLEAQFKNTEIIFRRNEDLYKQGVIAKAEFETSQAAYEAAKANLQALDQNIQAAMFSVRGSEATVKEQRKNLSFTLIYAPMSGVVSKLNKKKGEQVVGTAQMAGTPILKIANLNSVEARVDVNERDILTVMVGDTAEVEMNAYPGKKFLGLVTQIANTASGTGTLQLTSDQVTNFEVRILLLASSYQEMQGPQGQSPFRAGLSASARIRTNALQHILSVPIIAVTTREDETKKKEGGEATFLEYVFVQVADSVEQRKVKSGIQDDDYIQIVEGLKDGEMVVSGPYDAIAKKLTKGMKIRVVTEEELYKKKD